jgi:hypothetical protein
MEEDKIRSQQVFLVVVSSDPQLPVMLTRTEWLPLFLSLRLCIYYLTEGRVNANDSTRSVVFVLQVFLLLFHHHLYCIVVYPVTQMQLLYQMFYELNKKNVNVANTVYVRTVLGLYEAAFLDVVGTKVLRLFLLAIHSHLY